MMASASRKAAAYSQLTRAFTRTRMTLPLPALSQSSSSVRQFFLSYSSLRSGGNNSSTHYNVHVKQGSSLTFAAWLFPTTTSTLSCRHMSSSATPEDYTMNTITVTSLKNMMKPFFLKCHPDVQSTVAAKRVNLKAIQTINGLLDVTQATCEGKVVEWPSTSLSSSSLQVEFVITLEERVKKQMVETASRRMVELAIPSQTMRNAVVQSSSRDHLLAVRRLQHQVRLELTKLLKVAGLPVPVLLEDDDTYMDPMEAAWDDELDVSIGADRSKTRTFHEQQHPRGGSKPRYEQSRDRFVRSVDWKRIQNLYNEAVVDMEADLATEGSVQENTKRRQAVIINILSKVRVAAEDDIPMMEQLIAFRRLSLILEDNFEDLYMEDMGRMWENLVIVLKGERDFNYSKSAMRKRSKRAQETGYQFSYGTNGVVTIHIPIDFDDDELVAELDRNLWDFYNLIGDGMQDLYPRWFTD